MNTAQTFSGIVLPTDAENQAVVQVRWLYYLSAGSSGSRDRLRLDEVTISSTAQSTGPAPTITATGVSPAAACAGSTATVNFSYTGSPSGVTALLSNAAGSFASGTTVLGGTATLGTATGSITATVPATVAGGTGYLIRVNASGVTGTGDQALTVNTVSIAPTAAQAIATNANGSLLTATETPAGTSRQWYYSTTSGSGYTNAISGQTGTTYTPNFAVAGSYYVVVKTDFGTCTGTSNEVAVTVTAPAIATGTIAGALFCVGQGTATPVSVPFTVSNGAFAAGNVFTAYLSNDGFVFNRLMLGTLAGTGSGTIAGSISQTTGLTTAGNYRIRVEASSPNSNSLTDNGTDLAVASYLTNEVASAVATPGNTQVTLTFTTPANCVTNVVVTIKAGSAPGLKPATGGTFGPGAGTGAVAFGTGTDLGGGQYVVYNGPATGSITVTGLTNGSQYTFGAYTTNGGSTGTTGFSDGTSRTVRPVLPATLTEVVVPQFISGRAATGSSHTTRLPYVWRATLGSLLPNTTYKYYTAARASTDVDTYGGVGVSVETQTAGAFVRHTTPGLTSSSSTFVSDATGSYTGWFALEPTADSRFADQSLLYPMVVLNAGDGSNVAVNFLPTTSSVRALNLNGTSTGGRGLRGSSFGTPSNFVLTYDNTAGTGRPLAATWIEDDGLTAASYVGFYGSNVNGTDGAYGLLTPNNNPNGTRRVEQRSLADGSLVGCAATSANGTWASGAITANISSSSVLVLTTGDTPFAAPTLTALSASIIQPGQVITLTGTNFSASPNATITFSPGATVTATTITNSTSLTVTVPAGAGTGTVAVSNSCGTSNTLATTEVPPPGPGALLIEDDFDYADNEFLVNNGWSGSSSNTTRTALGNVQADMYPKGAALTALTARTSNEAKITNNGPDVIYRTFSVPTGATTLYAATIINLFDVENGTDYFLTFRTAGTTISYFGQVNVTKVPNSNPERFTFGFRPRSSSTVVTSPTIFDVNTSYVLVLKIESSSISSQDVYSLYVLPATADLSQEPASPLITTPSTSVFNSLGGFAIRQQGANTPSGYLDGIRVATGWGAAVGNPNFTNANATISPGNYYNVTLANADALTAAGPIMVENNLTLTSGSFNTSAANLLTVGTNATITANALGATGPLGFVNGPLARQTPTVTGVAASYLFPVGKDGAYRPITLTANAQTDPSIYTAEQFNASAGTSVDAPLERVSTKHYYSLTSSNTTPGNFTGTITLSFGTETGQEDYVNTPSNADLVIAKRDGAGSWNNIGRSANTGTDSGAGGPSVAGTLTSGIFSDFSDFTLASTSTDLAINPLAAFNPLPVELTRFTAQRQPDQMVALSWATASEKNSAYFEVQRSLDGREFTPLGHVAAQGNSSRPSRYGYLDRQAPKLLSSQAPTYYRLRQVDLDGAASFSPVVVVAGTASPLTSITLYPNPAHETLRLQLPAATPYRVLNALGQTLLQGTAEAGEATVPVQRLPAGLYHLELRTAAGRVVRKFVKE